MKSSFGNFKSKIQQITRRLNLWQKQLIIGIISGILLTGFYLYLIKDDFATRSTIDLLGVFLTITSSCIVFALLTSFVFQSITHWKKLSLQKKSAMYGITLSFLLYFSILFLNEESFLTFFLEQIFFWFGKILYLVNNCGGDDCMGQAFLNMVIGVPVTGFLLGSLIGYVLKKIKRAGKNALF